jgi:pimeloyl-ACP methyl ester carboxylesterase
MKADEFPLPRPTGPPARERLLLEFLTAREGIRLPLQLPLLLKQRATRRATVLLVPGLGATDASLLPLRTYLRRFGHDARSIGMGRITDDVEGQYLRVAAATVRVAAEVGEPVVLIGQSIGGVLVREAARDHDDIVKRVITFGTPVVGGPAYSQVARRYPKAVLDTIVSRVDERALIALTVPITAIWSRSDGIVNPAACFDRVSPNVEHVEVSSSHLGMGIDPDVWAVIADRLNDPLAC